MKIIGSISEIEGDQKLGITIGNFDGLHLGHKDLLTQVADHCHKGDLKFLVITFIPHPSQILFPQPSFLLNTYAGKRQLLKDYGVKYLLEIPFTRNFSTLSPEEFLCEVILKDQRVSSIFMGYDFAFGKNKKGNYQFVKDYCSDKDISVCLQEEFKKGDKKVSSSEIRKQLKAGDISQANSLLGRPYFLTGTVIKGKGRGKQIGIPTANLDFLPECLVPKKGVYLTESYCGSESFKSVTNIGVNPTFENSETLHVESHILDFSQNIYGESIEVHFLARLRDEKKFENKEQLVRQIQADILKAGEWQEND
ncbi:MAG: bifunctional riboflavin kinase/FAD synthetase [Halobacteriovoraceae bacterium]|jgi:riboflavin kinase / FMN adenylyltransferase|nr:bifunctional riboflavin kinase/FAD synthetase [Halobacteriovoraceae bacterium]MBT5093496.1 bifunctional riboflavin kinase/FAD synthetase [Halobacteriovoraceae bacterium]